MTEETAKIQRLDYSKFPATFQTKYGVNLLAEADRIATELDTQGLP